MKSNWQTEKILGMHISPGPLKIFYFIALRQVHWHRRLIPAHRYPIIVIPRIEIGMRFTPYM